MPTVAEGLAVRFVDPASPWLTSVGGHPAGTRLQAAIALRASIMYDDTPSDLRHTEVWEAVLFPLTEVPGTDHVFAVDSPCKEQKITAGVCGDASDAAVSGIVLYV